MRCSSCEILLDRYVEGTLPPQQMASISAHLKSCASCSAMLTELRVVDALLATTKAVELAPNFTFAVMAEARSLAVPARRRQSPWLILGFYLIGTWALVCAGYLLGSFSWARAVLVAPANEAGRAFAAVAGVAHGFSPAFPFALAIGIAALAVDALLIITFITLYRTLRPRLVAHLARTEAS